MGEREKISLMLIVTLGCNAECGHCCLGCNAQKMNLRLTEKEMIYYIEQAYKSKYKVDSVIFTGGEATLCAEDIYLPMLIAKQLNLHIDLRTNAHWAKSVEESYSVLQEYQERGLQQLGLSYDGYHKKIPIKNINNAMEASRGLGIRTYLDWIGLETYDWVLEHLKLNKEELRTVIPPLRVGRAKGLEDKHFKYYTLEEIKESFSCNNDKDRLLTIFPGGYASLHSCCWVNPALIRKIGNNGWLKELDKEMKHSPMVNYLSKCGIRGLIERAEKELPQLVKPRYSYQYEACYDLLGALFPNEAKGIPEYMRA